MRSPLHQFLSKSSSVNVGTKAPNFSAVDTENNPVKLSDLWANNTLVVIFLRHLGCTFCRQHVIQVRRELDKFLKLGAQVVCVAQGDARTGKIFKIMFDLPFQFMMTGDDVSSYNIYGLGRGTLPELFGPNMWVKGFLSLFTLGTRVIGPIQGDGFQMPGTFIIDRNGIVRFAYRNKDAADNPSNRLLLDKLEELSGGPQIDVTFSTKPPEPASAA